jgi:methionine-rich copper-binding protein CopC
MKTPWTFFAAPSRLGTGFLLAVALWLAPTGAWAHAYLEKAIPAQRAVVFAPPANVQLFFSERLEPKFCTVTVSDAAGKSVDNADLKVAENNPKQLTIGLKPLSAGVYTVKFRVLSVDGHVVSNQFAFTVRERR